MDNAKLSKLENCTIMRSIKSWFRHSQKDYSRLSWSQEAEDLILARYFGRRQFGFYVDVGAHHPERFSNTRLFHLRGWRGINIDAMPGSMKPFKKQRPQDTNLEIGIASVPGHLTYYKYDEPALNGFARNDPEIQSGNPRGPYKLIGTEEVLVRPLAEVLAEYVPTGQKIDLLSIDAEGTDLDVLQSNDWQRFKPECIVIEIEEFEFDTATDNEIYKFLRALGYRAYARSGKSMVFCIA